MSYILAGSDAIWAEYNYEPHHEQGLLHSTSKVWLPRRGEARVDILKLYYFHHLTVETSKIKGMAEQTTRTSFFVCKKTLGIIPPWQRSDCMPTSKLRFRPHKITALFVLLYCKLAINPDWQFRCYVSGLSQAMHRVLTSYQRDSTSGFSVTEQDKREGRGLRLGLDYFEFWHGDNEICWHIHRWKYLSEIRV